VRIAKAILGWWHRNDLNRLALLFHTDKWGNHWYTQHYQRYFQALKGKRLNVLEIGVGGYEDSGAGGGSLRMWKAYFRKSRIVGIDLHDKTQFRERRIDIRKFDQTDSEALLRLSSEYGGFDIIIDDGSHLNEHVIKSFHVLFPLLRGNGIYVVEDTQTAYWPTWGGGISTPQTSVAFFKGLVDGLNHVEYPIANYEPDHFDQNVVEIAFFHNLIFICKGNNDEKANVPELIQRELAAVQAVCTGINT
jgi:demethylmacrocin O-methyltransferase